MHMRGQAYAHGSGRHSKQVSGLSANSSTTATHHIDAFQPCNMHNRVHTVTDQAGPFPARICCIL